MGCMYVIDSMRETMVHNYEVLCLPEGCEWDDFLRWAPYKKGEPLPSGAIEGGCLAGQTIYICLGSYRHFKIPGYCSGHGNEWDGYVCWGWCVHPQTEFQVLVDIDGDVAMADQLSPVPPAR